MAVTLIDPYNNFHHEYIGLSEANGDTKPTDSVPNGSTYTEMDTGDVYYFSEEEVSGEHWLKPEAAAPADANNG